LWQRGSVAKSQQSFTATTSANHGHLVTKVGKVTLKSNGDEALSNESLKKTMAMKR
jgi:hypothetical protein